MDRSAVLAAIARGKARRAERGKAPSPETVPIAPADAPPDEDAR
jgi:hypothetical protein